MELLLLDFVELSKSLDRRVPVSTQFEQIA